MASHKELVQRAKLAEQIDRYTDMVEAMKQLVETGAELSSEERNLLSVAYKNLVGNHRTAWRIVMSVEHYTANEEQKTTIQDYRQKVEKELRDVCNEILALVDNYLLPKAVDAESKVFYSKMKGDYYRYLAEITSTNQSAGDSIEEVVEKSQQAYQEALDVANEKMPSIHPIRLGLVLNFSVFYYEILHSIEKAVNLAKKSFDEAMAEMQPLIGTEAEECYKDSTMIMSLLRENLVLWTGGNTGDDKQSSDDEGLNICNEDDDDGKTTQT